MIIILVLIDLITIPRRVGIEYSEFLLKNNQNMRLLYPKFNWDKYGLYTKTFLSSDNYRILGTFYEMIDIYNGYVRINNDLIHRYKIGEVKIIDRDQILNGYKSRLRNIKYIDLNYTIKELKKK